MDYSVLISDLAKEYSLNPDLVTSCLKESIIDIYIDTHPSIIKDESFIYWKQNEALTIPDGLPSLGYRSIQILRNKLKTKLHKERISTLNVLLSQYDNHIVPFLIDSMKDNKVLLRGIDIANLSLKIKSNKLRAGDLNTNRKDNSTGIYFRVYKKPEVNNNNELGYYLDRTSDQFISCLIHDLLPEDFSIKIIKVLQAKLNNSRSLVKIILGRKSLLSNFYSESEIVRLLNNIKWQMVNHYLPRDKVSIVRLNDEDSISYKISEFLGIPQIDLNVINSSKYKLPNWFVKRFHNKSELDLNISILNEWLDIKVVYK